MSVSKSAARELGRGHPWVWEKAVLDVRGNPTAGDAVLIVSGPKRHSLGFGFFDPGSPIRVRRVGVSRERPSPAWAEGLAVRALELRKTAQALRDTNAMRLIHGESDGASGLVIDRYDTVATIRFDGAAAARFWREHLPAMFPCLTALGIRSFFIRGEGVIEGDPLPPQLCVHEDRAVFEVDLERGHKTGLFLDQRPNRRAVGALADGKRVLNLCSYTGGFSIHAALGGAATVTSVDISEPVMAACRRNFTHSGLDPAGHEFVASDVFEFLGNRRKGQAYDLVVCDPPSFAPRRSAIEKAKRAYTRLNRAAIDAVARGGLLVTASCSSHITAEMFADAVADAAARARKDSIVVATGCAGADHPIRPGFPEGDYLKVLTIYSA